MTNTRSVNMDSETNQLNKQAVWGFWQTLEKAGAVSQVMADDVVWHGFAPIGELRGSEAFSAEFWQQMLFFNQK